MCGYQPPCRGDRTVTLLAGGTLYPWSRTFYMLQELDRSFASKFTPLLQQRAEHEATDQALKLNACSDSFTFRENLPSAEWIRVPDLEVRSQKLRVCTLYATRREEYTSGFGSGVGVRLVRVFVVEWNFNPLQSGMSPGVLHEKCA